MLIPVYLASMVTNLAFFRLVQSRRHQRIEKHGDHAEQSMNHYEFDQDAMVGRAGKVFGLGYKLHLSLDSETVLTLDCAFANQNEQKHSPNMLEKTKLILKRSAVRLKSVTADSQYSYGKLRDAGKQAMIPYWANQKRDVEGQLKVDKKIRTYDPEDQKRSTTEGNA